MVSIGVTGREKEGWGTIDNRDYVIISLTLTWWQMIASELDVMPDTPRAHTYSYVQSRCQAQALGLLGGHI